MIWKNANAPVGKSLEVLSRLKRGEVRGAEGDDGDVDAVPLVVNGQSGDVYGKLPQGALQGLLAALLR